VYQDDTGLEEKVGQLANVLRWIGVDCDCNLYHTTDNIDNWDKWSQEQIQDAGFVLLVCTKPLYQKLNAKTNNKIQFSCTGYIQRNALSALVEKEPEHFLPIILSEDDKQYVPNSLSQGTINVIPCEEIARSYPRDDNPPTKEERQYTIKEALTSKDFRRLVAKLTGQTEYEKPELAKKVPNLTSKLC